MRSVDGFWLFPWFPFKWSWQPQTSIKYFAKQMVAYVGCGPRSPQGFPKKPQQRKWGGRPSTVDAFFSSWAHPSVDTASIDDNFLSSNLCLQLMCTAWTSHRGGDQGPANHAWMSSAIVPPKKRSSRSGGGRFSMHTVHLRYHLRCSSGVPLSVEHALKCQHSPVLVAIQAPWRWAQSSLWYSISFNILRTSFLPFSFW